MLNTQISDFLANMYSAAEIKIIIIAGIIGGLITSAVGGFDKQLIGLLIFMFVDYVTGMQAAWHTNSLSSRIAFKGLLKKSSIVGVVAFCFGIDCMLKLDICRYAAIAGFGIMEALSIIENADRAGWGVIFPFWIRNRLQEIKAEKKLGDI